MFTSKIASLKSRLARLHHHAVDLRMMERVKLGFALDDEVTTNEITFGCYPVWPRNGQTFSKFLKPRNPVGTIVYFTLAFKSFDKGEASDMEVTTKVVLDGSVKYENEETMPSTSVPAFMTKKLKALQKSKIVETQPAGTTLD